MNKIKLFLILLLISQFAVSQIQQNATKVNIADNNFYKAKPITYNDSIRMMNIPELEVPAFYKTPNAITLPSSVDNSASVFFRPVTSQSGYECGQTAGQAFVYTYEVNRLRNLNSSVAANQYPTHFTWNFFNDAYNYNGVSFFETWEITRTCGTPNVVDYGGALNTGGEKRWMTGYSKYYNAMKNRLSGVYSIRCDSPEGIKTLKTWLFDHLEGANNGGLGAIYAQYCSPDATLASGTPEAGKALISVWGGSPSHAWTIVGYNDSIRYDFNGDGQYTNTIDINGDGIVNIRDWEIGGLKIVNGYAGTGWGNGGFSYMMFKALGDGISNGGIWNSTVYVIKAKAVHNPKLALKINMSHNRRNQVKVVVGVSQNINDFRPVYRIEYPIFNFQGASMGMQGDTTLSAQTIEFGLDITPLLSYVEAGQSAKYFLEIIEKDPSGIGSGVLNSFSIMDYTSGVYEYAYPSTNIALNNNDTSRFSINKAIVFDKVNIPPDSMNAKIYHAYSHQLNAEFGQNPYKWDLKMDFSESIVNTPFPTSPVQGLSTGNSGYVKQNLNFNFPFFGKSYNQIYIYADGFVKFDNSLYTFPYLVDADLLFRSHRMIAALYADLVYNSGHNVLFETDANSATIVWKAGVNGQSSSSVNVSLKIFSNGKIEIYYGSINITGKWFSAISGGDVKNYFHTSLSNTFSNNSISKKIILTSPDYPENMNLTEAGGFTAFPSRYYNTLIKFRVTDNNNVSFTKSIPFKTYGLLFDYKINAGGDTTINAGDTVLVSVKLKNIGSNIINASNMQLQISDSNVIVLDSINTVGTITGGDSIEIVNAFKFIVKSNVNDGHLIELYGKVISSSDTFERRVTYRVNSFLLKTGNVTITDGNNNILEPNETASIMLQIKNIGGATATNLHFQLSTSDPYVTLNPGYANIDTILPFSSKNAFFIITTSPNIPNNHLIVLDALITGSNNYTYKTFFFIQLGVFLEDFESNNFTKYDWTLGGNINWFTSDSLKYQGNFSAKSGKITHSQSSFLSINQYVLADGYIRFHRKVSSERDANTHNYDYLVFFIDGAEKARWDGEMDWAQEVYPVTAGNHTFKWTYVKDNSVNTGADCAWLDNIIFPLFGDATPNLNYSPLVVNKTIALNTNDTSVVRLSNVGNGMVLFTSQLELGNHQTVSWADLSQKSGGINSNENGSIVIQYNSSQLQAGNYNCQLVVTENFINQKIIPVNLLIEDHTGISENNIFESKISPNPFAEKTIISINTKEKGMTYIAIYDYTGKLITVLNNTILNNGKYEFQWNGLGAHGEKVSNGLYFCKIVHNNSSVTHKIVYSK